MSLPSDWKKIDLHDCVRPEAPICYGILMPGKSVDDGVPVIKVRDIYGGKIDQSNLLLTDPRIDEAYSRSRLTSGDLLITIRGTTGRVALVPPNLDGANITQDTARVRLTTDVCAHYLYHSIQSQDVQDQISLRTIGQAVKGINIYDVKRLKIGLPPLEEQRAIAEALSDVDALINALDALITKKRHIKQGTMQQLLTGKKRLPGFAKSKGYVNTEIGTMPVDWSVRLLDELTDRVTNGFVGRAKDHYDESGNGVLYVCKVITSNQTHLISTA